MPGSHPLRHPIFKLPNTSDIHTAIRKKSTFTKARAKLKASAFIEPNGQLNHQFADQCAAQNLQDRWRGLRLLGLDGDGAI